MIDIKFSFLGFVVLGVVRSLYCFLLFFRGRRKGRSEFLVILGVERFGGVYGFRFEF